MQTSQRISKTESQRGQALVEFALVLLFVILPITFVLIEGALLLYTLANVTNAAREGARAGSIYQSPGYAPYTTIDISRTNYIRDYLTSDPYGRLRNLVEVNQCNIWEEYTPITTTLANPYRELSSMTVHVDCPHRLLFGLVGSDSITLSAQSTMKIEPGGAAP